HETLPHEPTSLPICGWTFLLYCGGGISETTARAVLHRRFGRSGLVATRLGAGPRAQEDCDPAVPIEDAHGRPRQQGSLVRTLTREGKDDDPGSIGRAGPAGPDLVPPSGDGRQLLPREQLEADVVRDPPRQFRVDHEQPVGVLLVCVDARRGVVL